VIPAAQLPFWNELLNERREAVARAAGRERATEETGKIASELVLELGAGVVPVMARRALEGGGIVEQTGGSSNRCGVGGVCGVHAECIGLHVAADDP
jgi:hypothetical protein